LPDEPQVSKPVSFYIGDDSPYMDPIKFGPKIAAAAPGAQKQMYKDLLSPIFEDFKSNNTVKEMYHQSISSDKQESVLWSRILTCESSTIFSMMQHVEV